MYTITIRPIPIQQTPGCFRDRWFVELRFKGDNCTYDIGNFESRAGATQFVSRVQVMEDRKSWTILSDEDSFKKYYPRATIRAVSAGHNKPRYVVSVEGQDFGKGQCGSWSTPEAAWAGAMRAFNGGNR